MEFLVLSMYLDLYKTLDFQHGGDEDEEQNNKFQTLQGRNSILVKLEQMVRDSKKKYSSFRNR